MIRNGKREEMSGNPLDIEKVIAQRAVRRGCEVLLQVLASFVSLTVGDGFRF